MLLRKAGARIAVCAFFALALSRETPAIGTNKVIVKDFDWRISSTENFDVYFYDEGGVMVPWFTDTLEDAHTGHLADLRVEQIERTSVFLYVGHNDFEQTNVTEIGEGTGGVTEAFKNRFVVPHTGSYAWLDYVTRHEFTHVVEFNVLLGGFWKTARLLKMPIYPYWLMEGLAEYETGERGATERDMYVRDAATSGNLIPVSHLHNFGYLKPHQVLLAYKESSALMSFIAEEYGKEKPGEILQLYKERFDANSVLQDATGATLEEVDRKFREYLEDKFALASAGLKEPHEYGAQLTRKDVFWKFDTNPVFIPGENRRLAYITDASGFNEIRMLDIRTMKSVTLAGSKQFDSVEHISTSGRGLSMTGDGRYLVFVGEKTQKDYIFILDLENNTLSRVEQPVTIINSADITKDGARIYFVGMQAARTAVFSCAPDGTGFTRHTFFYDDVSDAAVSPDGTHVVFSREKRTDSIEKPYQRDLYLLDIKSARTTQLTDMKNDETSPVFSPDGNKVLFVSDRDGVNDLYVTDVRTGGINKLTQVIGGNFNPVFSPDGKYIAFSSHRKGERRIYLAETDKLGGGVSFFAKSEERRPSGGEAGKPFSSRPYRFKPSTDLFFPVFYYSTSEGAFVTLLWQGSEMLGNHSLSFYTQYVSAAGFVNYQAQYNFARFRPQFFVSLQGQGGYLDYYNKIYEIDHSQIAGFNYPLTRFDGFTFAVGNVLRSIRDTSVPGVTLEFAGKTHSLFTAYTRDTSAGKYTSLTRGYILRLQQETATDALGGDYVYNNAALEIAKYFPLGKDHSIALRTLGATSTGRDRGAYNLFGISMVRMNSTYKTGKIIQPYYDSNLAVVNLEYRFPIVYDIDYYMWYIFPDFFFKSFYGSLVFDAGQVWDGRQFDITNTVYCYGVGLKFDTFILQAYYYPMYFYLTYSPINDRYEFIFSIGSAF
jgi:hypothetical protein